MYMIKIDDKHVAAMYHIREELKKKGVRKPITKQVREALTKFIAENKTLTNAESFL